MREALNEVQIHPSAEVSPEASIGPGTRIWNQAQVREGVQIGPNCIVGKGVYIDVGVVIGSDVKIQNNALLYNGVTIDDGVFIGPGACLANDRIPRAITPGGDLKTTEDWTRGEIHVRYGASIGAGAIILPDVTIGQFAMVGAGAVVTHDVPDYRLVMGVPARFIGYVCRCGGQLQKTRSGWNCPACDWSFQPADGDS